MEIVNITDEAAARRWQAEVQRLNEETAELLTNVGKTIVEVQQGADSTIVDELVEYGNRILSGTHQILSGMNELVTGLTEVLKIFNGVLDAGKKVVDGFIKGITNLLD